jgi:hypothetical protein
MTISTRPRLKLNRGLDFDIADMGRAALQTRPELAAFRARCVRHSTERIDRITANQFATGPPTRIAL